MENNIKNFKKSVLLIPDSSELTFEIRCLDGEIKYSSFVKVDDGTIILNEDRIMLKQILSYETDDE